MADGGVAKCTFYRSSSVGNVEEGLEECWRRIVPVKLDELACDCMVKGECRGGCRYRAGLLGIRSEGTVSGALRTDRRRILDPDNA